MTENYTATLQQAIDFLCEITQELYTSIPHNHMSGIGTHVRNIINITLMPLKMGCQGAL